MESMGEIMAQSRVGCLRILLGFQLSFIDANKLLSFAGLLAKTIVGDPVKPGGKTRLPPKAAEILVGAQERLLGKIVRERDIGTDELTEQAADARLMIPDQLRKGVVVIIDKNASDEVCIGKRHSGSLGQRRRFVFTAFELPNEQITSADQEGNQAQTPGPTFPVVDRTKEGHQANPHHEENHTAPHIGARPNHLGRGEESRGYLLALLNHCADRAMEGTGFQVAEEHDRSDDHDRRAKERGKDDADNRNGHQCPQVFVIAIVTVVAAADMMSGSMAVVNGDPKGAVEFSRDFTFDRIIAIRGRRKGGIARRGRCRRRSCQGRGRQGRGWVLAKAAQREGNQTEEAEKKRYFHEVSFCSEMRPGGHLDSTFIEVAVRR
jgi:hypothetical protein